MEFLNFRPGLVGGHCIGVDPYYLTYKAKKIGINPKVVLAGRKVNDDMAKYFSNYFLNKLKKNIKTRSPRILILGASFKENISDIRNSKILELGKILINKRCEVEFFDPHVKKLKNNLKIIDKPKTKYYDGIIIGVKHKLFQNLGFHKIKSFAKNNDSIIFDLQNIFKDKKKNSLSI